MKTIQISESGYIDHDAKGVDCNFFKPHWVNWKNAITTTIVASNIEEFKAGELPIYKFKFTKNPFWKFKWFPYEVEYEKIGVKKYTFIRMVSGERYLVDQSYEEIKKAIEESSHEDSRMVQEKI